MNLEEGNPQKLSNLEEEIVSLKEVWGELDKVWANVEAMWDTPLNAIVQKKVRQTFDDCSN